VERSSCEAHRLRDVVVFEGYVTRAASMGASEAQIAGITGTASGTCATSWMRAICTAIRNWGVAAIKTLERVPIAWTIFPGYFRHDR
jgi:hypothetical protein